MQNSNEPKCKSKGRQQGDWNEWRDLDLKGYFNKSLGFLARKDLISWTKFSGLHKESTIGKYTTRWKITRRTNRIDKENWNFKDIKDKSFIWKEIDDKKVFSNFKLKSFYKA